MDSNVLFVSPYVQDANSLAEMLDEGSTVVHASSLKPQPGWKREDSGSY